MSILLQQIRRSIYSRRGTAATLTPPPHTVSRFYSTNYRALGPEEEKTSLKYLGKFTLKNGLAISFILGTFHWKRSEERKKIEAEIEKESESYFKVLEQLHVMRIRRQRQIIEESYPRT